MQTQYFDGWNTIKKQLNMANTPNFKEREVWYLKLGKNIGFEQNGKGDTFLRPVVVLKKFNNSVFWGIPLTTKTKESPYYFTFFVTNNRQHTEIKNTAILSQIRLLDARRLSHKIGNVSIPDQKKLLEKLQLLLNPSLTSKEGRPEGI